MNATRQCFFTTLILCALCLGACLPKGIYGNEPNAGGAVLSSSNWKAAGSPLRQWWCAPVASDTLFCTRFLPDKKKTEVESLLLHVKNDSAMLPFLTSDEGSERALANGLSGDFSSRLPGRLSGRHSGRLPVPLPGGLIFRETAVLRSCTFTKGALEYTLPGTEKNAGMRFAVESEKEAYKMLSSGGAYSAFSRLPLLDSALAEIERRFAPHPLRSFTGQIRERGGAPLLTLDAEDKTVRLLHERLVAYFGKEPFSIRAWEEHFGFQGDRGYTVLDVVGADGALQQFVFDDQGKTFSVATPGLSPGGTIAVLMSFSIEPLSR